VREQPNPIEGESSADRRQAQRLNPMKERFAQRELIDIRRRRAAIALVDETGVIHPIAQARMGLQTRSVRQVHGVRGDVVDRGQLVVGGRPVDRRSLRGCRGSALLRPDPWRADQDPDHLAAAKPAAKWGMAFAWRTGEPRVASASQAA
jgi:hypothetical protein